MDSNDYGRHEKMTKRARRENAITRNVQRGNAAADAARATERSTTERALAPVYTPEERRQLHCDARRRAWELRRLALALAAQCDAVMDTAIPVDDDTACALIGNAHAMTRDAASIGAAGKRLDVEVRRVIDSAFDRARGGK